MAHRFPENAAVPEPATLVLLTGTAWATDDPRVSSAVAAWAHEPLYVDPDFTGQGIGSRLIEVAKAASPAGLDLWTFQANVNALAPAIAA